ncbi:DUF58 domain-containing protein [Thalassotalea mangrovi]|uniref:DUF58 domain-containing protein n=1 Tax=Thalassotalea mangrovi TaxID=2572245 RepID=A0A4U1B4J8_9GAMM|nr:DUF58 domain-containing protein [Thalassotalea mangrovi]TKB44346.1 DUF58 domain-containing protein [Thalassotalea mangrovi]
MSTLLDPNILSKLADLPLIARRLAHGLLQGPHTSMMRGTGIEFSQYRAYEPGDDLARLDWKLFARSDKYFIRQAERESDIKVQFICDSSASMSISGKSANTSATLTKIEYARMLIATLAYLAQQQGDSVSLSAQSSTVQIDTSMHNGQRHLQRLMVNLAQIECHGIFPGQQRQDLARILSANMVVLVTDFSQQDDEIFEFIESLAGQNREVIVFQLQSLQELNFSYQGLIRFIDPETGEDKIVNAEQIKTDVLTRQQAYMQQVKQRMNKLGIELYSCIIEQPLDDALRHFLQNRMKLR